MTLYAASVPVFQHYLAQAAGMLDRGDLQARIGDGFPAGQQLSIAAGFSLRVSYPLAGRAVPEFALGNNRAEVAGCIAAAQRALADLSPQDFAGAEARQISHVAGFAELQQTGADFLYLYGLPNFFFHLTMGYAALRAAGADLGKADFDGLHSYPQGFRFR